MNDIMRYAFIGSVLFLSIIWFSIIVSVIKHDITVTEMMEHYKKENEMLREENKDMQERINALLNINTNYLIEMDWTEE